jgi:GntR family transcriptional regulator
VHIRVSPADDLPIYRQIMRQVMDAIAGGQLAPGDRLLSHRELAEQLVVAPLTVKKAYDELDRLGYISMQRGRGTFVRDSLPRHILPAQQDRLADAARDLLARAYLAGLTFPEVVDLLQSADSLLTNDTAPPRRKERARA